MESIVTVMAGDQLYEDVFRALLVESKVDTLARRLTQKVVNAVKKKMDDLNKKSFLKLGMKIAWPSFLKRQDDFQTPEGRLWRAAKFPGAPNPFGPMEITLQLAMVVKRADKDDVKMTAGWAPLADSLVIQMQFESTTGAVKPQHLSKVQQQAYDALRHELEHATQTAEKLIGGMQAGSEMLSGVPRQVWSSPKTLAGYFLSPAEIEAFTAGLYHKAKRTRTPFIKVVDETIEHLMRQTTKMGSEAVEMRNVLMQVRWKWIEYAKKRFPKAITGV